MIIKNRLGACALLFVTVLSGTAWATDTGAELKKIEEEIRGLDENDAGDEATR